MPRAALLTRLYSKWDSQLKQIMVAVDAIQQGIWLGLLDNKKLDELGILKYESWGKYFQESYNLSGLNPWEESVLVHHFQGKTSLLLASAGGGREAVALAKLGFLVDAFDSTPNLVEACRSLTARQKLPVNTFLASPGGIPEGLHTTYDGLIIGWGGYMHIPGRANRVSFLNSLREHAKTGSPLLLSFFCRSERTRRHDWIYRIAYTLRLLRKSHDLVEYGDTLDGTFDHQFTEQEILSELTEGGFGLSEYHETPYGYAIAHAV